MKVLLAVDGSKTSRHAVASLIKNVEWLKEKPHIDLVFVHLLVPPLGAIHGIAISDQAVAEYYRHDAEELLASTKLMLEQAGLTFSTQILVGKTAEAICKFADENHSDLIYMGTRGMGTVGTLLLGSTAMKVLHLARIPVVLVPSSEHWQIPEPQGTSFRT